MKPCPRISLWAAALHLILLRPFVKIFCGVNITGRDHLHDLKQFIIIANHNSHLDILLIYHMLPVTCIRRTHPVADLPYFAESRLVFHLVDFLFKPIWITRGQPDLTGDPFGKIKDVMKAGDNVIIFPEGTRGQPGEMEPFRSGIGRLMAQCPETPIVPVFLTGPERALPRANALLLPFWNNIIVGPPQKCTGSHREITRHLEGILTGLAHSEAARRHKPRARAIQPVRSLAFLGIDGSGKSTASETTGRRLSEAARVCLVSDELRLYEWGQAKELQPLPSERLRQRVGAYAKQARSLKHYKIPKLTELLLRDRLLHEAFRWYTPDLVVMDGSPLLNLLAWSVLYKPDALDNATCSKAIGILSGLSTGINRGDPIFSQFPELAQMRRLGLTRLSLPDTVILIDIDSAIACQRIDSRGEQKQVHETAEKLEPLRRAYIRVCEVTRSDWKVPTLILDGSQPRDRVGDEALAFARVSLGLKE